MAVRQPSSTSDMASMLQNFSQDEQAKAKIIRDLLERVDEANLVGLGQVLNDRGLISDISPTADQSDRVNAQIAMDIISPEPGQDMISNDERMLACMNASQTAVSMSNGMNNLQGTQSQMPAPYGSLTNGHGHEAQYQYLMGSPNGGATLQLNAQLPATPYSAPAVSPPPAPQHTPTTPVGAGMAAPMGMLPKEGPAALPGMAQEDLVSKAPEPAKEPAKPKDPMLQQLSQEDLEGLAKEALHARSVWQAAQAAQLATLQAVLANPSQASEAAVMAMGEQAALQHYRNQAVAQALAAPQALAAAETQPAAQPNQPPGFFSKATSAAPNLPAAVAQSQEVVSAPLQPGQVGGPTTALQGTALTDKMVELAYLSDATKGPASAAAATLVAQPQPMAIQDTAIQAESSNAAPSAASDSMPGSDGRLASSTPAAATDEANASTLILRNLPGHFDQQLTQAWIDNRGFQGAYDFCLWFPAKATSRLNSCGYAFVNFRSAAQAQKFRKSTHLMRIPTPEGVEVDPQQPPVSIAVAKVQGFVENYCRFMHLLEGNTPTRCQPFFAEDAKQQVSPEDLAQAAVAVTMENQHTGGETKPDGPATTLVIRNLPPSLETQEQAREWLNMAGFATKYDFFLYLPAKRTKRDKVGRNLSAPQHGYAYAFVNFKAIEDAQSCLKELNGNIVHDGDPVLNVVAAKIQGVEKCQAHFSTLAESGRCTPWLEEKRNLSRTPGQYQ